jgi:hypothetical protein
VVTLSKGSVSFADAVAHCLALSGPAAVMVSTWTIGSREIGAFRDLHASGPARVAWCPKPPASTFDRAVARAGSLHSVL